MGMVVKDLLKYAVSSQQEAISNAGFGWLCTLIGGGDSDALNKISGQLRDISNQIIILNRKVDDALSKILESVERTDYDLKVSNLIQEISTIEILYNRLKFNADSSADQSDIDDLLEDIYSAGVPTLLMEIQYALDGIAGTEGIIEDWGRLMTRHSFEASYNNAQSISDQFTYFAGLQLKALTLILEYAHAKGKSQGYTM